MREEKERVERLERERAERLEKDPVERERIEKWTERLERERIEKCRERLKRETAERQINKYDEAKHIFDIAINGNYRPKLPTIIPYDVNEFKVVVKKFDEETAKYESFVKTLKKELDDAKKELDDAKKSKNTFPFWQKL